MQKISNIDFTPSNELIVDSISSETGLKKEMVTEMFESMKVDKTIEEIQQHFKTLMKPADTITSSDFKSALAQTLQGSNILENTETNDFVERFIAMLSDVTSDKTDMPNMDAVNLISLTKDILISKNPNAKKLLKDVMSVDGDMKDSEITELNESLNFSKSNVDLIASRIENVVPLYEGLKHVLAKNTQRWRTHGNYHMENAYQTIVNYIDDEIKDVQLRRDMVIHNDKYNRIILEEMLSGNVSPLYKNFSSVKDIVTDTQTLIFDMILLVDKYMSNHRHELTYMSQASTTKYRNSAKQLLGMLYSSAQSSLIISDEFKRDLRTERAMDADSTNDSTEYNMYGGYNDLLETLVTSIDTRKLDTDIYYMQLKPVVDMLNFIASSSFEFNLAIRPVIRQYVTTALEISNKVKIIKSQIKI